MHRITILDTLMLILLIVGGLNWGLVALYNYDLVANLFGVMTPLSRVVYGLVGISALYTCYIIYKLKR